MGDPLVVKIWEQPETDERDLKLLYYSQRDYKIFRLKYKYFLIKLHKRSKNKNFFDYYIRSVMSCEDTVAFLSFTFRNALSLPSRPTSSLCKIINKMSEDIGKINFASNDFDNFYEFLHLY